MEEAGVTVGRPRARLFDELQELGRARTERRLSAAFAEHLEADRAAVLVEGAFESATVRSTRPIVVPAGSESTARA